MSMSETKIKILEALKEGEKCVCDIVKVVRKSQPTVSIYLQKLEKEGYVKSRREGKRVYYKLTLKGWKVVGNLLENLNIEWFPKIDENKCIGCGSCVFVCFKDVFDYDFERMKAVVKNPKNCIPGCFLCSIYCPNNAISLPSIDKIKEKIEKITSKAKQIMEMVR